MEWIYRLTQSPNLSLDIPPNIKYFIDPMKVIKHFKSCKLNSKHSKLETPSLSSVWKFINGKIVDGVHNSLVDAKAQTDVVIHPYFIGYLNKTNSIQSVKDIFQKKTKNRIHQLEEQARLVHTPWMSDENTAT